MFTNISKESGDAALITGSGPAKIISFGVPHQLYLEMAMSYMQNSFFNYVINKHDNLYELLYNKCNHGEIKHRTWLDKGDYKLKQWVQELSGSYEGLGYLEQGGKMFNPGLFAKL